ncbi:MAG TPA: glycosyltransferase family 4 protein [Acetobacteraceae bacterium]|nr:glycosyltransferase family 4 protein [Acetobacteraceae bacterium]
MIAKQASLAHGSRPSAPAAALSGIGLRRAVGRLTEATTACYLAASAAMVRRLIAGQAAARNFSRVVVLGPLSRRNGVAQGATLQWMALKQLGIDTHLVDAAPGLRNPLRRAQHHPGTAYVVHGGGPQAANLLATALPHAANAYRIAYLAWELPDPPQDWAGCDRNFDEIWTPSSFSRESLGRLLGRPIHVVPHHIAPQTMRERDPCWPFTVLALADSRSSFDRKNPEGALRAFLGAFGASPRARLILKLNGRSVELDAFERSCRHLLDSRNVEIVRTYLDGSAMARLFRSADVLLSLHRAEGFGLPLLEAMSHGIPVVATAWSGNMDFMSPSDSELVPYRLVPVSDLSGVYGNSMWAEPDIKAAACMLRRLADDQEHYRRVATAAHERVAAARPQFPFTP